MTNTSTSSAPTTAPTAPAVNHVFIMNLKTTRAWLDLAPSDRHAFVDSTVRPILAANPSVTMRYFESEAFSADVTDTAMWETADILAYQEVVEQLRETQFWGHYFEVVQILACIENAFALHYHVDPI